MLKEGAGVKRVILRAGKTDLRRGIDGLKSIIQLAYGMDPMEEGTLFLFCGTRRDRIRGLLYEGDGFLLLTKRITEATAEFQAAVARNDGPTERRLFARPACLFANIAYQYQS